MDTNMSLNLELAQIAWVVKDVAATKKYFEEVMGVKNFGNIGTTHMKDFKATYYGKPSEGETLVAQTYAGGTFIELIQSVKGDSIFQDYIDANPAGGMHHIAYRLPIEELDKKIADFESKGYPVISSFDTAIAMIVFFDTRKEIGLYTEIMGITKEGWEMIEKMKGE